MFFEEFYILYRRNLIQNMRQINEKICEERNENVGLFEKVRSYRQAVKGGFVKPFFLIGYIEQWGTGTNRIIEECLNHGLPEPLFEEITDSLVLTFRKTKLTKEHLENLYLNKRQMEVVKYMNEHKKITSKEYANLFKITDRTARNDLKELVDKNIVERKGVSDKTTYYVLAEI